MKYFLSLTILLLSSLNLSAQCTDLFISEYIEGSSNNKAIEIYNPTNTIIDLSDYKLHRNSNGSATSSASFTMFGNLNPGNVYVISNSQATGNIPIESDTVSGVISYNGDDAVWLQKISTGDTLDIIGVIGVDPGTNWPVDTGSTVNHTLIRKINIQSGQTDWAIGATEWDIYVQDMDDSLGFHTAIPCSFSCSTTYDTISVMACDTYNSPSGLTYSSSGTFNDTILNVAGCDSVITITLQLNTSSSGTAVIVACDAYTWIDGNTYTSNNNIATDTLTNTNGCDSVVTLNLTINYSTSSTIFASNCGPFTDFNGYTWTSDTVYTNTYTSASGCDSIEIINLSIFNLSNTVDVITTCDNAYTWIDGNTYTTNNNNATMVFTDMNGCDSTITLDLTFSSVDVSVVVTPEFIAAGQDNATYQWLDCNNNYAIVPGQTAQTLSAPSASAYAVIVTYNGCTDTSMCYNAGPNPNGLADFDLFKQVNIFPNPSQDQINIEWKNGQVYDLEMIDLTGKRVYSKNSIASSFFTLNHDLPAGIYFIRLKVDGLTENRKIIIE